MTLRARKVAPTTIALALMVASCFIDTTVAAPPSPRTEAAAVEARVTGLVAATGLDRAQADTVYRQLIDPPLVPLFREVVSETRPDGTRNIFVLFDNDLRAACRLQEPGDLQGCRRHTTSAPWLLFVQVAPDGRVVRSGDVQPFKRPMETAKTRVQAARLRLVAPSRGASAVAIVDGFQIAPPEDIGGGHMTATAAIYTALVWNGRDGFELGLSYVADNSHRYGNEEFIGRVSIDAFGQLSVETTDCDNACRCKRPASLAANDAEVERLVRSPGKCAITRRPYGWPEGFGLVADDLEARTPKRDAATARAALAGDFAAAANIPEETAKAIWSAAGGNVIGPTFGRFEHQPLAGGGFELFGLYMTDTFVECVYNPMRNNMFDAVRACAHHTDTSHQALYARINADGTVAAARRHFLGANAPIRFLALGPGLHALETFQLSNNVSSKVPFLSHEILVLREGRHDRIEHIVRLGASEQEKTRWDRYFGDLEVVTDGPRKRLKIRRAECSPKCPCPDLPPTPAAERALVDARATASNPNCRPKDVWVD